MTRYFLWKQFCDKLKSIYNILGIVTIIAVLINKTAFAFLAIIVIVLGAVIIAKLSYNPVSLFRCEYLDYTWDIQDGGAYMESVSKRKLISLCNNQKFYELRGLYTDGKIESISCGNVANIIPMFTRPTQAGRYNLIVEFFHPLKKEEAVEFSIIKRVRDTFLNNREDVGITVQHETERVSITIKFPADRMPKKWFSSHYHGQAQQPFNQAELSEDIENGRKVIKWQRSKNILLNDGYSISWEW